MKFDVAIMNPPYDRGLCNKILSQTMPHAEQIVSIQPLGGILYRKKQKDLFAELKKCDVSIEKIKNAIEIFDAAIGQILGIYDIRHTDTPQYRLSDVKIDNLEDIRWYSDDTCMVRFDNIVKQLYENDNLKMHILTVDKDIKCACKISKIIGNIVRMSSFRGHAGCDDFYTIISRNEDFNKKTVYGEYKKISQNGHFHCYISFETEQEMSNFLNYIKTDFARSCLSITKTGLNLYIDSVPWFDFSEEIFSKSPREIDDYLFEKYEIGDDIRKHLEEIIPDYYNIR